MTASRASLLLLLAGCLPTAPGELDDSVLRDLQIVGIEVDPPQIGPPGVSTITVTAADPELRGAEVLVWSCTDLGVGCYEQMLSDGAGRPLDRWARFGPLRDDRFTVVFEPPSLPEELVAVAEEDDAVMLLWALTCAPGLCDLIERVKANPAPGTPAWDVTARLLAFPDEWLDELEPGWASLAVKAIPIRTSHDNANPTITSSRSRIDLEYDGTGGDGSFGLNIVDDGSGRRSLEVFSTFGAVDGALSGGSGLLTWQAPRAAIGFGRVYAVVSDGEGGQAVWIGDVSVLP